MAIADIYDSIEIRLECIGELVPLFVTATGRIQVGVVNYIEHVSGAM